MLVGRWILWGRLETGCRLCGKTERQDCPWPRSHPPTPRLGNLSLPRGALLSPRGPSCHDAALALAAACQKQCATADGPLPQPPAADPVRAPAHMAPRQQHAPASSPAAPTLPLTSSFVAALSCLASLRCYRLVALIQRSAAYATGRGTAARSWRATTHYSNVAQPSGSAAAAVDCAAGAATAGAPKSRPKRSSAADCCCCCCCCCTSGAAVAGCCRTPAAAGAAASLGGGGTSRPNPPACCPGGGARCASFAPPPPAALLLPPAAGWPRRERKLSPSAGVAAFFTAILQRGQERGSGQVVRRGGPKGRATRRVSSVCCSPQAPLLHRFPWSCLPPSG